AIDAAEHRGAGVAARLVHADRPFAMPAHAHGLHLDAGLISGLRAPAPAFAAGGQLPREFGDRVQVAVAGALGPHRNRIALRQRQWPGQAGPRPGPADTAIELCAEVAGARRASRPAQAGEAIAVAVAFDAPEPAQSPLPAQAPQPGMHLVGAARHRCPFQAGKVAESVVAAGAGDVEVEAAGGPLVRDDA